MSNGVGDSWGEYQRLVLAELERHNNMIEGVNTRLGEIQVSLALQRQDKERVAKLEAKHEILEEKVDKLTEGTVVEDAIKKYRKWILGVLVSLFVAVAVPIIKLIFFPGL